MAIYPQESFPSSPLDWGFGRCIFHSSQQSFSFQTWLLLTYPITWKSSHLSNYLNIHLIHSRLPSPRKWCMRHLCLLPMNTSDKLSKRLQKGLESSAAYSIGYEGTGWEIINKTRNACPAGSDSFFILKLFLYWPKIKCHRETFK